ncbi:MAG: substrate-binding domain-containing protein [Leptospiraceae bacterium]|nr:substrate-binding domain-containing protein [Leptospiraceae bacterium]
MFKKLNKFGGFYSLTLLSILITVFPIYSKSLLNVSFDTTREVFDKINLEFKKIHNDVTIYQSHGGSSRQAGYVIAGLRADIVCLALPTDIQSISKRGFISND